ncbi:hypothetical protein PS673_02017 [Pseudomonas fluorescens]|jgi:hypothetical protein|uniref:Uncharacterized protein n=1 Tax=Pseudomonas fluorescens TaxID=294 RepID=A0A5E6S659_PSEFL|nr:hypothetical protein [Pseudomonas fluorescens]VVM75840.1 hypothetical protein PS673_02017 [Pseudomonas fluorescens]
MSIDNEESVTLTRYYNALNRLLSKDVKITIKAVAIEAGRSATSIKNDRPIFAPLIEEIQFRAKEQQERSNPGAQKIEQAQKKAAKARDTADSYKSKYEDALARQFMALIAWDEAMQELRKLKKVVPIKPPARPGG